MAKIKVSFIDSDDTIIEVHEALIEENKITYKQVVDGSNVINVFSIFKDKVVFERIGDIATKMEFCINYITKTKYNMANLSLDYEIKTNNLLVLDGIISIDYAIIIDGQIANKTITINY